MSSYPCVDCNGTGCFSCLGPNYQDHPDYTETENPEKIADNESQ